MASSLILPSGAVPTNLHFRDSVQTRFVESDLYDIAARLQALDDRLHIVELSEDDKHSYAIMEFCNDGVERLVFRVDELDARVLERVEMIMHVPFADRFAAAEAEETAHNEQRKEDELDDLYERLGRPMLTQLEHDGFIQRNRSYAKRGVAAPGRR